VTAGIDLCARDGEEDHGHRRALEIARDLVVFCSGRAAIAIQAACWRRRQARIGLFEELQGWIVEHLHEDLCVELLARQCGMSPRHFAASVLRPKKKSLRARFVETDSRGGGTRVAGSDNARTQRRRDACGVRQLGFHAAIVCARVGVTPGEYARRFRAKAPSAK